MARENNFLFGDGKRLTQTVKIGRMGQPKVPPYDVETARGRIQARLGTTMSYLSRLPAEACPRDEVVAVVTLHPRFISKSDFPSNLFSEVGLQPVGSRAREIKPDAWGTQESPESAVTEDLFVAGKRSAFEHWQVDLLRRQLTGPMQSQLTRLEDLAPFKAETKLRSIPVERANAALEIVLHNGRGKGWIVEKFIEYARRLDAEVLTERRRDVGGLTFIPVRLDPKRAIEVAQFSFVRVVRGMPSLRPLKPKIVRAVGGFPVKLPNQSAVDGGVRAVIFDGGIPAGAQADLSRWVSVIHPQGIGPARSDWEEHGLEVTSAFLFGPLKSGAPPNQPICSVDHVRVLDEATGTDPNDLEVKDALDRILNHFDQNPLKYELMNISLGPDLAVDDDEVTEWTSTLDARLASGTSLATVAVGNNGELDRESGNSRVQVPSDAVNVLAVGAATSEGDSWTRTTYSAYGPGRRPGLVKPDGLAFGGSTGEKFGVLKSGKRAANEEGTSYAAPLALRAAASVRAQLGPVLNPLALRALMVHRATCEPLHDRLEVGWGRFEVDPGRLITCEDDEALVVYQGELPVSQHLRASIPMPKNTLVGPVWVTATLVISPDTDPENPSAYTRAGLEVIFRPNATKFPKPRDGKPAKNPQTKSFFSAANLAAGAEYSLREDGHKWEPCLKATMRFQAKTLNEPMFDIYYHHRSQGAEAAMPQPIPYALVVGVKVPKVPDFYDRVVRAYQRILTPMRPQNRIQLHS